MSKLRTKMELILPLTLIILCLFTLVSFANDYNSKRNIDISVLTSSFINNNINLKSDDPFAVNEDIRQ